MGSSIVICGKLYVVLTVCHKRILVGVTLLIWRKNLLHKSKMQPNNAPNPTPESKLALRGNSPGGVGSAEPTGCPVAVTLRESSLGNSLLSEQSHDNILMHKLSR